MSDNKIVEAVLSDAVVQAAIAETTTSAPGAAPAQPQPLPLQPGQSGTTTSKPDVMLLPSGKPIAVPTTTEEEDRATVGQRRINLIWEVTQSFVAITITLSTLYVAARMALADTPDTAAFLLLSNVFFLVLGTYFQRTNHIKTGGVAKGDAGR